MYILLLMMKLPSIFCKGKGVLGGGRKFSFNFFFLNFFFFFFAVGAVMNVFSCYFSLFIFLYHFSFSLNFIGRIIPSEIAVFSASFPKFVI